MRLISEEEISSPLAPEVAIEDYEVLYDATTTETSIFIRSGAFSGVKYQYQKVTFDTESEEPTMHYQYLILEGVPYDKLIFENAIAHVLYGMLLAQLERNEVIYTGGTDTENT